MSTHGTTAERLLAMVIGEVASLTSNGGDPLHEISGNDELQATLALSSRELVSLMTVLSAKLECDPFEGVTSMADIHTVNDLCTAYERALSVKAHRLEEALRPSRTRTLTRGDRRRARP